MQIFKVVVLSIFCFSCDAPDKLNTELTGTVWECKIAEGCINTYRFITDSTFRFLSCEMQDEYFGDYYFKDGFLMIDQKGSIYKNELAKNSLDNSERKLYKVSIKGNKLKHESVSDWINGNWIESDFKFDINYLYQRK
jgi:hypothetical protein